MFLFLTLERKFFVSCLNSFKHIAVQKKGEDEGKVSRAASCASASLQRGKDFPVASPGNPKTIQYLIPGRVTNVALLKQVKN